MAKYMMLVWRNNTMKILLIVDRWNWAYHSIAKNLIKYNNTGWDFGLEKTKGNAKKIKKKAHKYDYFFVLGWQNYESLKFLPKDKTLVGIHSAHAWDDRRTTPDKDVRPPLELIDNLNGFLGVNAVSLRLTNLFKDSFVDNVHYTPNGVDENMFSPAKEKPKDFYVGFSGTKKHDWRKGISEFIIPAAKKAGVEYKLAMLKDKSTVPLEEMPDFYKQLSCYICASSSEGFSLSVLEAASCGVPVISTRVGGCTELIDDLENGFLVDRDVNVICEYIKYLKKDDVWNKISTNMRKTIVSQYTWKIQSQKWFDFMRQYCV